MLFGMMFGRFLCMVLGLEMMPVSNVRVMGSRFVVALLILLSGFVMMFRGLLVMIGCFFVMFCAFVCRHLPSTSLCVVGTMLSTVTGQDHSAGILLVGHVLVAF